MATRAWAAGVATLACTVGAASFVTLGGPADAETTPAGAPQVAATAASSPTVASALSGKRQVAIVRVKAFESVLAMSGEGKLAEVDDDSGRQRFVPTPLGGGRYQIKAYGTSSDDPAGLKPSCWQAHKPRNTQALSVEAAPCDAKNKDQRFTITAKGEQSYAISTPDGAYLEYSRTQGLVLQELGDAPLRTTFRFVDNGPAPQSGADPNPTPPVGGQIVTVPVYFHFITDGDHGRYPQTTAQELVDYANKAFSGQGNPKSAKTPFRFKLANVRYVENKAGPVFVHEIGHWLGLIHTFFGECGDGEGSGDQVDDTPAHREDFGDEAQPDTCPKLPGKDPVQNFMAYHNRAPLVFTAGQAARMNAQWAQYRAG